MTLLANANRSKRDAPKRLHDFHPYHRRTGGGTGFSAVQLHSARSMFGKRHTRHQPRPKPPPNTP